MESIEEIPVKLGKIVLKTSVKAGMNVLIPGSAIAVDLCEAGYELYNGDCAGACVTLVTGIYDLFTFGQCSAANAAAKSSAKSSAKKAAVNAAQKSAKTATKKIGSEASKAIAKGETKNVMTTVAKHASKQATKKIGDDFAKEIRKGMLDNVVAKAAEKTILSEAAKGAGLGVLESGGKNVIESVMSNTVGNVIEALGEKSTKELFKSYTAAAAKDAAMENFKKCYTEIINQEIKFAAFKSHLFT